MHIKQRLFLINSNILKREHIYSLSLAYHSDIYVINCTPYVAWTTLNSLYLMFSFLELLLTFQTAEYLQNILVRISISSLSCLIKFWTKVNSFISNSNSLLALPSTVAILLALKKLGQKLKKGLLWTKELPGQSWMNWMQFLYLYSSACLLPCWLI